MPKKQLKPKLQPKAKEASDPTSGSLSVPNHLLYCDFREIPDEHGRYPAIHLQKNDGGLAAEGLVFVDDQYGLQRWVDRTVPDGDPPPTWMDPVVFFTMVGDDPRVGEIVKQYFRRKNSGNMQELRDLLIQILEDGYASYLWEQFNSHLDYIAEFVVAAISSDLANMPKAALKPKPQLKPKPPLLKPRPAS